MSGQEDIRFLEHGKSRAQCQVQCLARLALTLVAVEGKTYAEAAEILEVPTGTIMSRIARARRNLMETWAPEKDK